MNALLSCMLTASRGNFQGHPFHMVSPSPWPIYTSISLLSLTCSIVLTTHAFSNANYFWSLSIFTLIATMFFWFRDIIAEGTYLGDHTLAVQKGLNIGIGLFIISETLFFLAIFWAYFHSALSPTVDLGAIWPPVNIESINPFELPLINTIILLSSGVTGTYSHHCLIQGNRSGALKGLLYTIILAIIFSCLQAIEYYYSTFTLSDGIFGSCFFFGTGFHGLHVLIGTIYIFTALLRIRAYHLTQNHHFGLEGAMLYWHFVDIIWLYLYISIYYWGS